MAPVHLPLDDNSTPIPALRYKPGGAKHQAVTTGAQSRITLPAGARMVSIVSEGPVKLEFGDGTVTADANSHYFPAGVLEYVPVIDANGAVLATHVSVIAVGADTIFHLSERA